MKNLLGHVGERLGHVGEVTDLSQTIRLLLMLQYRTQVNQMRDAWYWRSLNTVLAQSDDDGVAKDAVIEIQRRDADNGVVPVISVKKAVSSKKIIGHLYFNIYPFWDSIVSDNLVVRSDSISDKSWTKSDNYQYINYLREQNASLIVIMIDWQTIRWRDYSHRKIPRNKKVGKCWAKSRKCRETGIEGRNNLTWRYVCRVKAGRSGLIIRHLCDQPTVKMLTVSGDRRQMADYSWPAQG